MAAVDGAVANRHSRGCSLDYEAGPMIFPPILFTQLLPRRSRLQPVFQVGCIPQQIHVGDSRLVVSHRVSEGHQGGYGVDLKIS